MDSSSLQDPEDSFQKKLEALQKKATPLQPLPVEGKSPWSFFSKILGDFAGSVLFCLLLGLWLDKHFHTLPLWISVLTPLGFAAGIFSVWRRVQKEIKK